MAWLLFLFQYWAEETILVVIINIVLFGYIFCIDLFLSDPSKIKRDHNDFFFVVKTSKIYEINFLN